MEMAKSGTPGRGLGETLVEMKMVTPEQLKEAIRIGGGDEHKLGKVLVEQGVLNASDIAMARSFQLGIAFFSLKKYEIASEALRLIPEQMARKYNVVPLAFAGDALQVAMEDVENLQAIEDLSAQARVRIEPVIGIPEEIQEAINLNYSTAGEIQSQISQIPGIPIDDEVAVGGDDLNTAIARAPVVRLLDLIVNQAIRDRASDIHIEPQESRLRIRYRIDGILHEAMSIPLSIHPPLLSRLKILAGMNIAERRRPQDGQFSTKEDERGADIRVATSDTIYGEMAVLRILEKKFAFRALPELGFSPDSLQKHQQMLKAPFGMILVGGPTGSGKTTTLYASLNQLDRKERNIITIEDPIEYRFRDINQIQVNPRAGITFANGLRSIMRLDPDVILVGEIRDAETAAIAVQAALTGHLVLSSIHANDSVGVLFRLLDLGVEPFLITSVLVGILSQRMARRVCPYCSKPTQLPLEEQLAYEEVMGEKRSEFLRGVGCNICARTGYLGRTGAFEIMVMTDKLRRMVLGNADTDEIYAQASKEGMVTLQRDGMLKVKEGITTPYEVLRNVSSIGQKKEET